MENKKIPPLKAQDVECRVQQITENQNGYGAILLLYKDARVDMKILDQVYGEMNWQRRHTVINGQLFCSVLIWDESKKQWIEKQDVGTESATEAEKGRASDSFKRACFNVGIGRELYNAPFIYIKLDVGEVRKNSKGKPTTYTRFNVTEMEYSREKECFTKLVICDEKGRQRYSLGGSKAEKPAEKPAQETKPQEEYEYLSKFVRRKKSTKTFEVATRGGWKRPVNVPLLTLKQMAIIPEYQAAEFEIQLAINDLEARQTA